jgi:HD-GYP domain-containing protein (c-di-GMP phosphodiesterase class II)
MKKRGKILYSILILLIAIGLIPLVISDWKLIGINRDVLQTKEKEMQQNITSSIARMISLYLEGQKEDVRNIALSVRDNIRTPRGLSSMSARAQQNLLAGYLERHPDIRKIILLDNEGRGNQMGYTLPNAPLNDYLTEAYNSGQQGEEYLSNTYFVDTSELRESVVIFSTPIKSETGRNILGVISTIISLSPIQEFIKERSRYGHTVYCIDNAGNLIAHSEIDKLYKRADLTQIELVDEFFKTKLLASITKSFTLQTEDGSVKMLGTSTPILNLPWAVFVQMDEKKAYWSVHQMMRQTALWGALTFFLAIFLGIFFARGINSPIQKLAQGAKALSTGDFSHRIEVTTKNELADLADTFNSMTNKIRLFISQIEHAAKENKALFISSIKMLAAAIDEKDPYTRGHSERVTHYSVAIARNLNLSPQEIETVQIAALLHDVGKIGIDDEVLRKPGKLTKEEYEIIKQHPRKGAYIMAPVKQLTKAIPGMLYHHEFMDGSGYPEGLKGSEIPMIARIIAVADCFDAITSDRPYQKAFEIDKAIKRLFDLINSRYDAKVVAALVEAYEQGEIIVGPPKKKLRDAESETDLEIKKEV